MRRGEGYERWVRVQTARICQELGVDLRSMRVREQARLRGTLDYVADIVAESEQDLVIIECKDKVPTTDELLLAHARVVDVAHTNPERNVYGVVLSTRTPHWSGRRAFDHELSLFDVPDNLVTPLRLFVSPMRVIAGNALLWELRGSDLKASVIHRGRRTRSLAELDVSRHADNTQERLEACLETLSVGVSSPYGLADVTIELAVCLMHVGGPLDAHNAARLALIRSEAAGATRLAHMACVIETSAAYKLALVSQRSNHPGMRSIARLTRLTEGELEGDAYVGALQLIGAWHGLYGDAQQAHAHLHSSIQHAEVLDTAAYSSFLGFVRLAEVARDDLREQHIASAAALVPDVMPLHREWTDLLIARLEAGEDTSIASPLIRV